ncbi:hypothetical protein [Mycoplasmopsis arginini]|uniref:hypothetical protein n=1 Tax=Mycoplasmopsis arginini TaxID=2094 RepID=UPI0005C273FE|nr:hypothetical protein [Mycoplasmopsis arginini]BAQ54478.1 hypothetical protein MARG145_0477 [Mycoplasmopsis arginini]
MQILKLINSFSASVVSLANNIAIVSPNINISEEEKRVLTFVEEFLTEDSKELESIAKQLDIKFSAKKNIERMFGDKKDEILKKVFIKIKKNGIINPEEQNFLELNDEVKSKLNKKFHSILVKSLKQIKLEKKEINNNAKSYYKRIKTDIKNMFEINDDGVESSKNVENKILNLKELLDKIQKSILQKTNLANRLLTASTVIKGISIGTGLAAASLYALIPFTFSATSVPAAALSLATGILGSIASALKMAYYDVLKTIESFKEIEDTLSKYSFMTVNEMASKTTSFSLSLFKLKYNIMKFDSLINPNSLSRVSAFIGPLISTKKLLEDINELEEFKKINNEIKEGSLELLKTISRLETIRWTVINEIIIDKPYTQGGVGGANTHFKNLKTGEIKTLEELLKLNDFELSINGLLRVKDPNKGEYLRTFPNKVKWDNLG